MAKKLKFIFKEIIYPACFYFTIYIFAVYGSVILFELDTPGFIVRPAILGFGICYFIIVASANLIFRTDMSMIWKLIIHYCSIALPLALILGLVQANNTSSGMNPSTVFVVMLILSIIYAIFAIPVLIIYNISRKSKNNEKEYNSQFK